MKPIYLTAVIGIILLVSKEMKAHSTQAIQPDMVSTTDGNAHTSLDRRQTVKPSNISAKVLNEFIRAGRNLTETKITGVNIKAVRDFIREYKEVEVKWFTSKSGYTASFFTNGINTKVVYDDYGRRLYSLRSYNESDMTFEIRDLVKRNYYDHAIIGVYQFDFDTKTVYVVRMQDKQSGILTLKVEDGKIEEVTRF